MNQKKYRTFHDKENNKEYIIIKDLWYRYYIEDNSGELVKSFNNVDLLTNPFTECTESILSMTTSPEMGMISYRNDSTISYKGIRVPNNNEVNSVNTPVFKETFIINTLDGNISGSSVYPDSGSGDVTEII